MNAAFSAQTRNHYAALAHWIAARRCEQGLRVLGINGGQGSGKSALAGFLVGELQSRHGLNAIAVSLDDFYLARADRAALAARVHPLLNTRGVPGTHDVHRGIASLKALRAGESCALPRFSKASDDRLPASEDRIVSSQPDLILFEGWCVGTPPQAAADLQVPINALERSEDPSAHWRRYVNDQLAGPYAEWFSMLDALVYLAVPGWPQVREWRAQQERDTAAQNGGTSTLFSAAELDRFIQHYQRLTLHALAVLPPVADVVLRLDAAHNVIGLSDRGRQI
ncbi:MAG TPA: hypothetical protein VGE51_09915 [Fontimonas sp.]